jgi:hypothetical protein
MKVICQRKYNYMPITLGNIYDVKLNERTILLLEKLKAYMSDININKLGL